jgi:UDP-N-acetylglucosamine--N-acetylmuramyl-(pentapeptide) pyrophosphoryl-undecaprenol N-acetylglucosamine transferase
VAGNENREKGKFNNVKIGLACGGTGGHTFPGLATAEVLRSWGHEVTLWLAGKDIESASVKNWDGPSHTIYAEGFQHGVSVRSLVTARHLYAAYRQCLSLMKDDQPDVMLGMGSYASVGPLWAARRSKVPIVLHEANVIPGRAVTLFSRYAVQVAASFQETRHYLQGTELSVTGMPLRKKIELAALANGHARDPQRPFTILLMGGSRGSRPLNEIVSHAILNLKKMTSDFHVIHLTGQADE